MRWAMSARADRRRCIVASGLFALASPTVLAETFTGQTSSNWDVGSNWSGDAVPSEEDPLTIADTTNNSLTLNDGSHSIGLLTFGDTGTRTTAFAINVGTNTLTMKGGLSSSTTTSDTGIFLSINGPVTVDGNQTWTVGGPPGSPITDAGVSLTRMSGGAVAALTLNGTLTKEGPGQLSFAARNISNGNILVNAGVLKLNAGSSSLLTVGGTGTITLKDKTSLFLSKNSGTMSLSKAISMEGGSTLSMGSGASQGTTTVVESPISFAGSTTILVHSSVDPNFAFNGPWSGSGTITAGSSASPSRVLRITGNNSSLSARFVNNAVIAVGSDTALGTGTYEQANNSAALRSVNADARVLANALDIANNMTFGSADTGNLTFSSSSIATGSQSKTLSILNTLTRFTGVVTGGPSTFAMTKAGAGTLEFAGANTYDRPTAIDAGTLLVTGSGRIGTPSNTRLVTIASGAKLELQVAGLADGASLAITSSTSVPEVFIAADVNDVIAALTINGTLMGIGTYGSSTSGADNFGLANPDDIFSGTGRLTVVPEPGGMAAAMAGMGLLLRRRTKRACVSQIGVAATREPRL